MPESIESGFEGTALAFQSALSNQLLLILAAVVVMYLVLGVLQENIRESAEKRKKTPSRPAATRRLTPSVKTKRRTGSLGNN